MKAPAPTVLNVHGQADGQSSLLGRISYNARDRSAAFQWSEEAIAEGVEWSPLKLPVQAALWNSSRNEQELMGLPGLIHDAMPDGWGLLLMDRAFGQAGISRHQITPLLRLAFLANRCWGALSFDPEWGGELQKEQRTALDLLAKEAQAVQEGDTEQVSKALLMAGGSPHGARPKIMVAVNEDTSKTLVGYETLPEGYRHVLIKFAGEGEDPTHPVLEYAYGEAARRLGIQTAAASLVPAGGRMGLCLDRFDRQHGQRQHVHSMAGILHISHRIANADWNNVADILKALPGGNTDLAEAFKRAVFNSVFSVRDDHTKNISFQRTGRDQWGLSPAYDIAYSDGPGGFHTMTYAEHRGEHVTLADLNRLADTFEVDEAQVLPLVQQAQHERSVMTLEARGLGVSKSILSAVGARYKSIDKALKPQALRKRIATKP